MDIASRLKKVLGEKLKEHEVLKSYTTAQVGGVADFFYEAQSLEQLMVSTRIAYDLKIPYFVLGSGSQILVSDYGFPGLVIRNLTSGISFILEQSQTIVDSGVNNARLVMEAASRDLGGIEFLATVPGTIGGAVYSNNGNFGFVMASLVRSMTIFTPPDSIATHDVDWLKPGYLSTQLKTGRPSQTYPPVILSVKLQLQHYKSQEIVRKIAYYQKLAKEGFVIFKNPTGLPTKPSDDPDVLERQAPAVLKRIQAGKFHVGQARVSPDNPNFVQSQPKVRAKDFRQLVENLKTSAKEQAGILLEETFEYVGKWE